MKRNSVLKMAVVIGTLLLASCATTEKSANPGTAWISNMHRLSQAYLNLMPYSENPKAFADPRNHDVIRDNMREIVRATADIVHDPKAPNADPIINYTSTRFAIDANQAFTAFEMKDLPLARYSLGHFSDYCINCHTRTNRGAKDFPVNWQLQLEGLMAPKKIESLLANRQYASALAETRKMVADTKSVNDDPRAWQVTVEKTMAMVIRVDKNSEEATELAKLVAGNPKVPFYIRNDADSWLKDIRYWRGDKPAVSAREKLKVVERLVRRASARPQSSANLISSLRASGMLHELLENTKSSDRSEYLYQAGLVAQSLRDINLGYLDQFYFENCIVETPHSEIAENCFVQLQTSVHATNLFLEVDPEAEYAVQLRLSDLRKLAEPVDPESRPGWRDHLWDYDLDQNGKPQPKTKE